MSKALCKPWNSAGIQELWPLGHKLIESPEGEITTNSGRGYNAEGDALDGF